MATNFVLDSWVSSVNDDECLLHVHSSGAIFHIQWIPSELTSAPTQLENYHKSLKILKNDDGDDYGCSRQKEEADKLWRPFNETMSALAPEQPRPPYTLHQRLYPTWFLLIATVDESLRIQPKRSDENPYSRPGVSFLRETVEWVPNWYSSNEIKLINDNSPLTKKPVKVLIRDQTIYHFRAFERGYQSAWRELETFRKISNALTTGQIPSDMRICRLHGVVCDNENPKFKSIIGLLLVDIKIRATLTDIARSVAQETRQRWAKDLATIVHTLHRAGILWGDAKPDNVLVDEKNELWVIDFNGGYSSPWVSRENSGKEAGDLEGLKKIQNWLASLTLNIA